MELGTKQNKLALQRTLSTGITPDNGRLGVASRRGMKAIARDCGEAHRFPSWHFSGACRFYQQSLPGILA